MGNPVEGTILEDSKIKKAERIIKASVRIHCKTTNLFKIFSILFFLQK